MISTSVSYATDYHTPVLCDMVLKYLITDLDGIYVDATAGGGGHVSAILAALSPKGRVLAIDRDADAVQAVNARLAEAIKLNRLAVYKGRFSDLAPLIQEHLPVTGLLLDLGVSSYQLDSAARGFSHRHHASLDMRMDADSEVTASDIVNGYTENALVDLVRSCGEEPNARKICRSIVAERPVETTTHLASIIRSAVPTRWESKAVSRTFQSLRIAVNEELNELEHILELSPRIIAEGGRIVVISYHSLEDRRVKRILRDGVLEGEAERDLYGVRQVPWKPLTRRPIVPNSSEIMANRRSRSAKLRAAIRCSVPLTPND